MLWVIKLDKAILMVQEPSPKDDVIILGYVL